jgi:hypothetical protein
MNISYELLLYVIPTDFFFLGVTLDLTYTQSLENPYIFSYNTVSNNLAWLVFG